MRSMLKGLFALAVVMVPHAVSQTECAGNQTSMMAVDRSGGYTFVRWMERVVPINETYRVYRSDEPLVAGTNILTLGLDPIEWNEAALDIPRDSKRFYSDQVVSNPCCLGQCNSTPCAWSTRFLEDLYYRDALNGQVQEVPDGWGMLVLPLNQDDFTSPTDQYWYAVTTVSQSGVECGTLTTNNVFGPIEETSGDPEPLLIPDVSCAEPTTTELYLQYMDPRTWNVTFHAPNQLNAWYGETTGTNRIDKAIQYAYTYVVDYPDSGVGAMCEGQQPAEGWPATLILHGVFGANKDLCETEEPEHCAVEIRPHDMGPTFWYGFAKTFDYRTSDCDAIPTAGAGGPIVNYTEQRLLQMVHHVLSVGTVEKKVDPNKVYVRGGSMGASGTLALAARYPAVFAAAYAPKGFSNYSTAPATCQTCELLVGDPLCEGPPLPSLIDPIFGDIEAAPPLPTEFSVPDHVDPSWGEVLSFHAGTSLASNIRDWQNHKSNLEGSGITFGDRLFDDAVPIGLFHSQDDPIIPFCSNAAEAYAPFNQGLRTMGFAYECGGEHEGVECYTMGMLPALSEDPNEPLPQQHGGCKRPFYGFGVRLDETVPGMRYVNFIGSNACPDDCLDPDEFFTEVEWGGSWNYQDWDPDELSPFDLPPVDTASTWAMSFRNLGTTNVRFDITPRRLQAFSPELNKSYSANLTYIWQGNVVLEPIAKSKLQRPSDGKTILVLENVRFRPGTIHRITVQEVSQP